MGQSRNEKFELVLKFIRTKIIPHIPTITTSTTNDVSCISDRIIYVINQPRTVNDTKFSTTFCALKGM